jgi:limonene-1,2-epoxide hydrolase
MAERVNRRAFLGVGAALTAAALTDGGSTAAAADGKAAAALSDADRKNVSAVRTMASTWSRNPDMDRRNSVFTPDYIFRQSAERPQVPGLIQRGPFGPRPPTASWVPTISIPVAEMHNHDIYALDPIVVTSHRQTFPDNLPPGDDWYAGVFYMQNGLIREWTDWSIWQPKPVTPLPAGFGKIHHGPLDPAHMPPVDVINVGVVQAMCAAWERGDLDTILAYFDPQCRFRLGERVETPHIEGVKDIKESLSKAGYFDTRRLTIQTRDILALSPLVVTSQRHVLEGGQEAWFIGQFFVEFGRIREWINYQVVPPRPRQTVAADFGMFKQAAV